MAAVNVLLSKDPEGSGIGTVETPSVKELEQLLNTGRPSCNHADEVWPNLFLGDLAAEFIHKALTTPGAKILVHCAVGISRSSSLVLAYLMIFHHLSLVEAIQTVKEHRWIHPNRGFLKQLRNLDIQLRGHEAKKKETHNDQQN
ncbi:dual specificity protein phosphatase 26-like isoform X4 [Hemicordylus capensis]|uniref:dual specificity protein phosphatase 26-like isoform X4 n=1 Tax=Hemicordylus capensis TaxID=884348 RepID=UPI0023025507|nr:dual specificity protein phosphatase 26-like isoform X4 [Hemicordylus capensis]